jgi:WD40 repeat protein
VRVWDAVTGKESCTLEGHKAGVGSVAFSHDGKRIVSGSKDVTVKV